MTFYGCAHPYFHGHQTSDRRAGRSCPAFSRGELGFTSHECLREDCHWWGEIKDEPERPMIPWGPGVKGVGGLTCAHPQKDPGTLTCPRWREPGICCIRCDWYVTVEHYKIARSRRLADMEKGVKTQLRARNVGIVDIRFAKLERGEYTKPDEEE